MLELVKRCNNTLMPRKDQTETATNIFTMFMEGLRSIEALLVGG
jgi:hypothetical protein